MNSITVLLILLNYMQLLVLSHVPYEQLFIWLFYLHELFVIAYSIFSIRMILQSGLGSKAKIAVLLIAYH